jgi:hypothetical protein
MLTTVACGMPCSSNMIATKRANAS